MKRNMFVTAAAALFAVAGLTAISATSTAAEPGKGEGKSLGTATGVQPGDMAPAFELKDTAGNTVSLASLTKGNKAVLIEWYNPGCPFIVKHHKTNTTFNTMYDTYASQGVAFVAINSSAEGKEGYGVELNAKSKTDWNIKYPILMDPTGATGKAYGAKTTPHIFIITADGKVAYNGAIDDNRSPDKAGETNYAAKALDAILKGESVETASTKPYGCSVKYAK